MKKSVSLFLSAVMLLSVFSAFPFSAFAAEYPLQYNGHYITDGNASDVTGDGSVSYDPESYTLTLNNANIESNSSIAFYFDDSSGTLTVNVIGNCRVKCTDYRGGMMEFGGNCVFNGNSFEFHLTDGATLDIVCGDWRNYYTYAINAWNSMTVSGEGTLNVYAGNSEGYNTAAVKAGTGGIITEESASLNLYAAADTSGSSALASGTLLTASGTGILYAGSDKETATKISNNSVQSNAYRYVGVKAKQRFTVTLDANGGTKGVEWQDSFTEYEGTTGPVWAPPASLVTPPQCTEFDGFEFDGERYAPNTSYTLINNVTLKILWKATHTLTKVPAVKATTKKAGNKEYYFCPDCGKYYADAEGTKEITDKSSVIIVISPEDAALPTEEATEELIKKTNTDKKDVAGSTYAPLKLKATTKAKTVTIKWKAISGADGYIIYGAPCGSKLTRLATVTNPKTVKKTFKKLKKGKYYKYMVVAYKKAGDGSNRVITKSKSVHIATAGGKKGNPTGLKAPKKLTVKKGKKIRLKATVLKKKKVATHIAKLRYESANKSIATVDAKGYIKAKKKGTVTIYVYTQSGICKTVKVKVK